MIFICICREKKTNYFKFSNIVVNFGQNLFLQFLLTINLLVISNTDNSSKL